MVVYSILGSGGARRKDGYFACQYLVQSGEIWNHLYHGLAIASNLNQPPNYKPATEHGQLLLQSYLLQKALVDLDAARFHRSEAMFGKLHEHCIVPHP